jgi:hypothetical protein
MPAAAGREESPLMLDVHQHLWGPELIDELRRRGDLPRLRGWTLETASEAPYEVRPDDHDTELRAEAELAAGTTLAAISMSSPLGIETMPHNTALLAAYHRDAARLPAPFAAWAAISAVDPDLAELKHHLQTGFVGLQLPASELVTPSSWELVEPVLQLCADLDKPVLIHPGPQRTPPYVPTWWAPVVGYVDQLSAAWWAFHAAGRDLAPRVRVCFVAGAGLAPLQHERFTARGGHFGVVDPDVYVDTSSYGPRALDALVRVLGIDALVRGSDRPYADPTDPGMGDAAAFAVASTNPARLLGFPAPPPSPYAAKELIP